MLSLSKMNQVNSTKSNFFSSTGSPPPVYKQHPIMMVDSSLDISLPARHSIIIPKNLVSSTNGILKLSSKNKQDKELSALLEHISMFKSSDDLSFIKTNVLDKIKQMDKKPFQQSVQSMQEFKIAFE